MKKKTREKKTQTKILVVLQISSDVAYSTTNHLLTRTLVGTVNRKYTGEKFVPFYETKKNPSIQINENVLRKKKHPISCHTLKYSR